MGVRREEKEEFKLKATEEKYRGRQFGSAAKGGKSYSKGTPNKYRPSQQSAALDVPSVQVKLVT